MSASKTLRQAGSFSKMTSIISGQRVLRRGVLPGAGIKTPGGSCGRCARSGSIPGNASLLVSSGILCDMVQVALSSRPSVVHSHLLLWSVWQKKSIVKGKYFGLYPPFNPGHVEQLDSLPGKIYRLGF